MLMAAYLKRMGLESSEADKAEASTEFWPGGWIKQQTVHRSSGRDGSESKELATIAMHLHFFYFGFLRRPKDRPK